MPAAPAQWDAPLYAAHTAHHRAYDGQVLDALDLAPDGRVLDVGCGAGDFTARLATLVPAGEAVGLDPSARLVALAAGQHHRERLRFVVGSAQGATAVIDGPFDAVLSTAALHWVPEADHPLVLRNVRDLLRPGGTFRAEFGGAGQIAAARAVLDEESVLLGGPVCPWYFPEPDVYTDLLRTNGLVVDDVRLVRQRRSMPDAAALLGWLRSQVLIAYEPGLPQEARERFRTAVEQRAEAELRRADGTYDQDYVRLMLLAHRS